jgi:predicted aspartyl protease
MQHAFTIRYGGLTNVIFIGVGVCQPVAIEEVQAQKIKVDNYIAIWDTGATHSAITKKIADSLGLIPTGVREIRHANGKSAKNTYLVNIGLPNGLMINNVRVTEVDLIPDGNIPDEKQPQLLIGMDIIGMGDFSVTNFNGKTTVSFRMPSSEEIDFVPQAKEENITQGGNRQARKRLAAMKRRGLA